MKKIYKKWLISISVIVFVVVLGGFFYLKQSTYTASSEAQKVAQQAKKIDNGLVFEGKKEKPAIIFYQGAFVEKESYSIWAQQVAEAGFSVYLLQTPFNLAIFDTQAAQKLMEKEQLTSVVLGGHSLGGVIASRAANDILPNQLQGVFFLASYPDEKGSLKGFDGAVLSLTGDYDGVLNQEKYQSAKQFLPKMTLYQTITGGNHAGFGSYGDQKGDNQAKITNSRQQQEISTLLIQWLETL